MYTHELQGVNLDALSDYPYLPELSASGDWENDSRFGLRLFTGVDL